MGLLCSCHRAQKTPWHGGRAVSHDHLSSPKYNGLAPHVPPNERNWYWNGHGGVMPSSTDALLRSPQYATAPRYQSMRISNYQKTEYSNSTLGPESGFSSKASSSLENTNQSVSAPSSPHAMILRKPPPKPPRMRNHNVDSRLTSTDTLSIKTPTPSMRSDGVQTLKSSIVDVTNALDTTFSQAFEEELPKTPASPAISRYNISGVTRDKVFSILSQTKEFLTFELEPDAILSSLTERGVINKSTEQEIRRARNKQQRCEYLIDVITAKGHEEFTIFCDTLRSVGSNSYLSDFLEVLDALVEIATAHIMKPIDSVNKSPNIRLRAFSFEANKHCSLCSCNNNYDLDESFNEDASFDIDISYVHRDTGETRCIREVACMKRRKRPLSVTSEDFALLEEADKYIPMISVSLYNQCMMHGGIDTIAHILKQYACVRELSLVKNHINTESMKTLCSAIVCNRSLTNLDIRLNHIGEGGAAHLARALTRNSSLRMLKVTSTGLCSPGCDQLLSNVSRHPSLAELDIGFNEMNEQTCEALSRCLAGNGTLRKLRMRCNGISPYGAKCVLSALKKNSRVSYLDISGNKIRDESALVLSEVLLCNRTLKDINLENCSLTGEGCSALTRALKTNTSLRSLDLSMNDIGDRGAKAISEGLKYNQGLDTLCLNMCSIGNTGFLNILDALRYNTSMLTLKLCYNEIGRRNEPRVTNGIISDNNTLDCCFEKHNPTASPVTFTLSTPSSPSLTSSPITLSTLPPLSPTSHVSATTPSSPTSALSFNLRNTFMSSPPLREPVELMYETLCDVLQQNKDLKVLLWGNNFDDHGQDSC